MDTTMFYRHFHSPLGRLLLTSDGQALTGLFMTGMAEESAPETSARWKQDNGPFVAACRQLTAYFEGEAADFDLDLNPAGTPFQRSVWQELRNIAYGRAISYAELARRVGKPGASRAVGSANGQNPIALIVPCHRVIGADGTLTGYGGGLDRKRWLLEHEAEVLARHPQWRQAPEAGAVVPRYDKATASDRSASVQLVPSVRQVI
jgi:methylated-DNA-[protein]-cysteine S-methyltransferase